MNLSTNLRYLRKKNNYSQDYIADLLGYKSYTTIQKWEMGVSEPSFSKLNTLAELYNIDLDRMMNSDLEYDDLNPSIKTKGVRIPVLGRVAAGIPIEAIENIIGYEEISEEMAKTGDYYCLEIKGDSMAPELKEKTIVVIRKQSNIESGEVGVVFINGSDATVKRVIKHENGISLISFNPVYLPKFYTCEEVKNIPIEIIGRVVESRTKY